MKLLHTLLLGCAVGLCLPAVAQFQWIDHNGHRVFSDQPPPADIPEKNIISGFISPPTKDTASESTTDGEITSDEDNAVAEDLQASAAAPISAVVVDAGVDPELEHRQQQAEADEKARLEAEEARVAAARAENCRRAQDSRRALESGMRMARVNDKGERVVLDDNARAAEIQRADAIIASECD